MTLWLVLAASAAIGLFACSADSLWIDEAWMALLASERTLTGWWHTMQDISGSTLHMPLYTFYLWVWEKFAGHNEWALRAANIPFFLLGQWALFRSLQKDRRVAVCVALVAALSPFIWGYLAEARPYMMQYGGACLVIAALIEFTRSPPFTTRDLALFCLGLLLLCGSSALAFPWAGTALVTVLILSLREKSLLRLRTPQFLLALVTALLLLVIFVYDVWAFRSGAKASSVGHTNFLNLLFVGYELLGFIGLGPGRLTMREAQSIAVLGPYIFSIAALGMALAIALWQARGIGKSLANTFLLYSIVPLIFITLLAFVAPFRLLGRHMTPLAPVLFVIFGYAAATPTKWRANQVFVAAWLLSALMLRLQPRHHRDDYRDAAREAKAALAENETVWWSADSSAAAYYGLPLGKSRESSAITVIRPVRTDLAQLPTPDLVVASKPDIYDPTNQLGTYLKEQSFVPIKDLPAFRMWRRPAALPAPR